MKPPYEISNQILKLYGEINERLGQCRGLLLARPEPHLRRENRIKTIHSSLAIEGNTLGLDQVTAILDNKRVLAPAKDILEVQNAIRAYDKLFDADFLSIDDFLKIHGVLLDGLVDEPGKFRSGGVGIMKGNVVQHVAPPAHMVLTLMKDLFAYLKNDDDSLIIKSCVFHYEMEFIHPFQDGNGRMGRYWQTRILMNANPIFEYLPVESTVKQNQNEYYRVLAESDNEGKSTKFITFMLDQILISLDTLLKQSETKGPDYKKRTEFALSQLEGWFDRKMYMDLCKGVSTATASRDLKQMIEENVVEISGTGRMTRYRKI